MWWCGTSYLVDSVEPVEVGKSNPRARRVHHGADAEQSTVPRGAAHSLRHTAREVVTVHDDPREQVTSDIVLHQDLVLTRAKIKWKVPRRDGGFGAARSLQVAGANSDPALRAHDDAHEGARLVAEALRIR
jgi:hypothetical protein